MTLKFHRDNTVSFNGVQIGWMHAPQFPGDEWTFHGNDGKSFSGRRRADICNHLTPYGAVISNNHALKMFNEVFDKAHDQLRFPTEADQNRRHFFRKQEARIAADKIAEEIKLNFDPFDQASIDSALAQMESEIDSKLSPSSSNPIIVRLGTELKANFRTLIQEKIADAKSKMGR